jgi:hypothetical protein
MEYVRELVKCIYLLILFTFLFVFAELLIVILMTTWFVIKFISIAGFCVVEFWMMVSHQLARSLC